MPTTIPFASEETAVLLTHAPYPGRLMFGGLPSSLLAAMAPFAASGAPERLDAPLGLLDPGIPSPEFYDELRRLSRSPRLRAACISTSTAAIEETARIVRVLREGAGDELFVIAGGPHEDDCQEKIASRIPGVDLSIAGDAEYALDWVLRHHLEAEILPRATVRALKTEIHAGTIRAGRGVATSRWWGEPTSAPFDFGAIEADELPLPPTVDKRVRFSIFDAPETVPLMISRGCAYGKCTFCAEGIRGGGQLTRSSFAWIEKLISEKAHAALYFQDSIFPMSSRVREELLPMLARRRVEWGCQVYLKMLSPEMLRLLAAHGCTYVYTGVESASNEVLAGIGKPGLVAELVLERVRWIRDAGLRLGISLMFGCMGTDGELLETEATLAETEQLVKRILATSVHVAGIYPNVQTILPGTKLATAFPSLDFYRQPKCELFSSLEDGAVGYNFLTIPGGPTAEGERLGEEIVRTAQALVQSRKTGTQGPRSEALGRPTV